MFRNSKYVSLFLLNLILSINFVFADTIYVDRNFVGTEGATGSSTNPFVNIQTAIDSATTSDTIYIKNGTYIIEQIDINKELTIIGQSESGVILDGSTSTSAIFTSKSNNITISNLKILGPSKQTAVLSFANITNLNLNHLDISDGQHGITLNGVSSATLDNLTITNNKFNALLLQDCTDLTISNLTTSGNGFASMGIVSKNGDSDGLTLANIKASEINPLYSFLDNNSGSPKPISIKNIEAPQFPYFINNLSNGSTNGFVFFGDDADNILATMLSVIGSTNGATVRDDKNRLVMGKSQKLQDVIDSAASGEAILVPEKTFFENILISKPLTLKGISLLSTIDGGNTGPAIEITSDNVVIDGITIKHGGIHSGNQNLEIKNNVITDNNTGIKVVCADCSTVSIHNNQIYQNIEDVSVGGSTVTNPILINNWWGNATGPTSSTTNLLSFPWCVNISCTTPNTPPIISITYPINNSTISNVITLTASSSDDKAVIGVQFFVDSVATGTSLNTKFLTNAQHTISAVAVDADGAHATSTISVYVNNIVTPIIPTGGGGGGGGGGGSYVAPIQQSIATTSSVITQASLGSIGSGSATTTKPIGKVLGISVFNFKKNLSFGMNNNDVKELQKVLIASKFMTVSANGNFGPATKKALIGWQKKNNLPTTGYFGPMSRAVLNKNTF